jgi:hypothetical protein
MVACGDGENKVMATGARRGAGVSEILALDRS